MQIDFSQTLLSFLPIFLIFGLVVGYIYYQKARQKDKENNGQNSRCFFVWKLRGKWCGI